MRILVTGGRDYSNRTRVHATLENYPDVTALAQGGAAGADRHAREWAARRKVECLTFGADWAKDGKAAGPLRNQHMLEAFKPDLVIAFPGGRGTADCLRRARALDIPVLEIR